MNLQQAARAQGITVPLHKPFLGHHIFVEVSPGLFRCRCGDEFYEALTYGGGMVRTMIVRPCRYRPQMRYRVERGPDGLPQAMHWQGYW